MQKTTNLRLKQSVVEKLGSDTAYHFAKREMVKNIIASMTDQKLEELGFSFRVLSPDSLSETQRNSLEKEKEVMYEARLR